MQSEFQTRENWILRFIILLLWIFAPKLQKLKSDVALLLIILESKAGFLTRKTTENFILGWVEFYRNQRTFYHNLIFLGQKLDFLSIVFELSIGWMKGRLIRSNYCLNGNTHFDNSKVKQKINLWLDEFCLGACKVHTKLKVLLSVDFKNFRCRQLSWKHWKCSYLLPNWRLLNDEDE